MTARTITLTDRSPVRIDDSKWPIIAESADSWYTGQSECETERRARWNLKVRQHADSRAIVYASYDFVSSCPSEESRELRDGVLLSTATSDARICRTIKKVANRISQRPHHGEHAKRWPQLAAEAIASMPVEELE